MKKRCVWSRWMARDRGIWRDARVRRGPLTVVLAAWLKITCLKGARPAPFEPWLASFLVSS